ncbi:MAG: DNA primase [Desulfobacteraceae bacterium]|nr:DNA primase [Desulfobacteraceae bacterium]
MTKIQDIDDIRRQVEARRLEEAKNLDDVPKKDDPISARFITDCLNSNELGDGALFTAIHRGEFLFNKSSEEWLQWNGTHWRYDIMGAALAGVEDVVEKYNTEVSALNKKIQEAHQEEDIAKARMYEKRKEVFKKRISRLRTDKGRRNCLKFAHTSKDPLAVIGEEFDAQPMLLPCKNTVIDLTTGSSRKGLPENYLIKACPHEWKGIDEPAPLFQKWIREIFSDDEELVAYIQKLFGYGITGKISEHIFAVFHGQGRNGKGLLVETISYVLGDLVGPVQSEMLLNEGTAKNSSAPSPDIMALRGMRIVFASETDEGKRFSPSRVKWLSGGDTLVGRYPHDRHHTTFDPTHQLFLLTNHKPHAPADDFAFWERIRLIPFNLSFVDRDPVEPNERPVDKTLPDRLKTEASGILAWLVRGCLLWQKEKLIPPAIVTDATKEYRRNEDLIGDFIDQCCVVEKNAEVAASELYTAFDDWFRAHIGNRVPKQKKFGSLIGKRFGREKVSGRYRYYGLKLNPAVVE